MSRCKACNVILSDYELVLKSKETGEYYDMCGYCLRESLCDDERDLGTEYEDTVFGEE